MAGAVRYTDCFSAECYDIPLNECLVYDTKKSDGLAPVMLQLWEKRRTPLLTLLAGPHRPGVVALNKVLYIGQIELNYARTLN